MSTLRSASTMDYTLMAYKISATILFCGNTHFINVENIDVYSVTVEISILSPFQ